jgi:ligand-binding sensor domain-containing protein/signal transduction histidine kinase
VPKAPVKNLPLGIVFSLAALLLTVMVGLPGDAWSSPDLLASTPDVGDLPPTAAFTHLTVDQGLADQMAAEITQDTEGFMWFGTFRGLDRYDGYRFVHYRHDDADPHSLTGNVITALYADRDGNVWVGARGAGLDRFDPRTRQFEHFRHDASDRSSLSSNSPRMIYQDRAGVVWIASEGGGLSRFNPGTRTFTNYLHDDADGNSIASNTVRSIAEDASGVLWLGTANGLSRVDPRSGAFETYRHSDADQQTLGANNIWKIVVDHVGTIWLATENGLDNLDPNTGHFAHYLHDPANPHSLSGNPLDGLLEDDAGRLWVGTFGSGVSILEVDRQSFTNYRHDPGDPTSLGYDQVDKIFRDRSGLIWLGTGGGGVDVYNPQQQAVTIYRAMAGEPNSLSSPFVYSVVEDADGFIWVGTRNSGLDRLDHRTGQVAHFPSQPGIPGRLGWPVILDLAQDTTGALWLAAYGGGLYRRDPSTGLFTAYRHDPADPASLSHDNVRTLRFDEHGTLWIATNGGGLNSLDPGTGIFTAYRANQNDPDGLATDMTVGLDTDRHGGVWVGTAGGGLNHLDVTTGRFTRYQHDPNNPNSLAEDNVFVVHVDRAGVVWIGTQGGGLDRLDPSTSVFTHYHQQDGLPSERVQSIVEDGNPTDQTAGNLWIVTDRGVARLDKDRQTIHAYGTANGLPSAQFAMGSYIDREGDLLIANLGGLVVFDPTNVRTETTPPPVVLTDFRVDNKPADHNSLPQAIDFADHVEIGYGQRVISFEFAALSYTASVQNRYRYKLEGFDSDWTEVDATRRAATYTNLEPGSYVFRVTGSNADGVWNETGRSLIVTVNPPWWATLWFRGLGLVLITGALGGAYVWRERTLRGQQRRLEALVYTRTHELQTALATREAALATRDAFLRTLAHDLKAPVANLAWHVQLLIRRAHDGRLDPQAMDSGLQAVGLGAAEVIAAVDELHDLTRLAAGAPVPLQRESVDLVAFARERVSVRRDSSPQRLGFESSESDLWVDADRARLGRVLDNLLDNATKYSTPDQPIEVSVGRESLVGDEWAVLRVQDHGIGIPAADLPHVFERYHRGGNVGSRPGEGLGLASARQVIALHGGVLKAYSQEGVGSTFTIRLPLRPAGSTPAESSSSTTIESER